MRRRFLSILLSVTMVVTMMPAMTFTAFAAETEQTAEKNLSVAEILEEAVKYEYQDYTYTGNSYANGNDVYYTVSREQISDGKPVMDDLARFVGALWRFDGGKSAHGIKYNDVVYTWDQAGPLKGSNWVDGEGNTLISAIVAAVSEAELAKGTTLEFKLNGEKVNVHLSVLTKLTASGAEDVDYKWDGDKLVVLKEGVTVSGATANQSIVVDGGVSGVTLDNVKIVPTVVMQKAIESSSSNLTIKLVGENQIGGAVHYASYEDYDSDFETEHEACYLVKQAIVSEESISFTGSGNLTIYDRKAGISAKNITFDQLFSGKLTIEDYGNAPKCAIEATNDVTLSAGTFILKSYKSNGISANNDVIIRDATVTINSGREELNPGAGIGETGIYSKNGDISIFGNADVAAGGKDYGIYVENGLINIGKTAEDKLNVIADGYEGGIKSDNGNISILAGTVKARAHKWGIGVGNKIDGSGNITISGKNTKVVAFGGVEEKEDYKYGCGIYAVGGSVTIREDAGVIAKGYDYGIGAEKEVKIQGKFTNVSAEGGYSAPGVEPAFTNNNTLDTINAYGIFAKTDGISVWGGTVEAHGCDGAFNLTPNLTKYKVDSKITAAAIAGDDYESAVAIDPANFVEATPTWASGQAYAEIFSTTLKEMLSIDENGNAQIAGKMATDAKLSCYGLSYDKNEKILTLAGFKQDMSANQNPKFNSAIKLASGIKINLEGENSIVAPKSTKTNKTYGIKSDGTLGIIGTGKLAISYAENSKTTAVAADKLLSVGEAGKTATLTNAFAGLKPITTSDGIVLGRKINRAKATAPLVIEFKPIIIVKKSLKAPYPVEGEGNDAYKLYNVSAENFAEVTELKIQWKSGDAWVEGAPAGVTLDTEGKIATTTETETGEYIFRITNGKEETDPAFVSSDAVKLIITKTFNITNATAQGTQKGGYIVVQTKASAWDVVEVNVVPAKGYVLESLVYTYNGKDHAIKAGVNGKYSFVMPVGDVTVTAKFKKNNEVYKKVLIAAGITAATVVTVKTVATIVKKVKAVEAEAAKKAAEEKAIEEAAKEAEKLLEEAKATAQQALSEALGDSTDPIVGGYFDKGFEAVAAATTPDEVMSATYEYVNLIAEARAVVETKMVQNKLQKTKAGSIKVSYVAPELEGVVRYVVQRATDKKFSKNVKTYKTKKTTLTNSKNLKKGTRYYYQVYAQVQLSDGTVVDTGLSNIRYTKATKTR